MFGIGFWETFLIFLIAIIFIKPEEIPVIMKRLGKIIGYFKVSYEKFIENITTPKYKASKVYDAHIPKEYRKTKKTKGGKLK